jgi:hypothetical protein
MKMTYKDTISEIQVAKNRTVVYQLLSKAGIEAGGIGNSISRLISKAVRDKDYQLGVLLRTAKARLDQLENIQ